MLYGELLRHTDSPVVAVNRAVAVGMAFGPALGLRELEGLKRHPALGDYAPLAIARADMLRRLGRADEARVSNARALDLCQNRVLRAALLRHLAEL